MTECIDIMLSKRFMLFSEDKSTTEEKKKQEYLDFKNEFFTVSDLIIILKKYMISFKKIKMIRILYIYLYCLYIFFV